MMKQFKQTLICQILAADEGGDDGGTNGTVTAEDVKIINKLPNPPPVALKPGEAYVRKLRLAGNQVNQQHGCFRDKDLKKLLKMVQGAPLLAGHVKEMLPMGRFFGGEIVEHLGGQYIAPKFYWPTGRSDAENLRIDLDSGVVCEASISFAFQKPTCSICGEDIRMCDHIPGEEYKTGVCFYWYDDIVRVWEGSLCYRGAHPNTGIEADNALLAALAAKTENNQIKGGSEMDLKEIMGNMGLPADTTEAQLKVKLEEGKSAVIDLKTAKTELAAEQAKVIDLKTAKTELAAEQAKVVDLTAFKANAEPVIGARRTEAERLMNLVYEDKPGQEVKDLLANAGPEKVETYITEWQGRALGMFPMTCQNCGSTSIKGRSSSETAPGGQQPAQRKLTPEEVKSLRAIPRG